jgi:acyl-coenzyme A thioesterase PaaI-like protein
MMTIDSLLRRSLEPRGDDVIVTLDPAFQGLPHTAHGGSVLAVFDAVAGLAHPRCLTGLYRKRVPLGVPLRLLITREAGVVDCRLLDAAAGLLVEGRLAPARSDGGRTTGPGSSGHPLPVSSTCFACGLDNAWGLRARLAFDERLVWARWEPRECFRSDDGALAPVAVSALLDEAAFWLGALATGESGMTSELDVILHRPLAFGRPLTVIGERAAVTPLPGAPRYWQTVVAAIDDEGAPVATARIVFVAIRGAARRLVTGMLTVNPPEVVGRVFPAYSA